MFPIILILANRAKNHAFNIINIGGAFLLRQLPVARQLHINVPVGPKYASYELPVALKTPAASYKLTKNLQENTS